MNESSKRGWAQVGKWLPGVIISGGALYALFRIVRWQDLVAAVRSAKPGFILAILVLAVVSLAVRGKAWQTILGKPVTWTQAFFGVCEGYFLNDILPFKVGEFGRSIYVGKISGLGTFRAFSSVIIERAFDLVIAASLVLVTLPLVIGTSWIKPVAIIALIVVVSCLGGLFFVARHQQPVIDWLNRVTEGHNFIKQKIVPQLEKLIQGFGMLTKPSQFFLSLFWIALTWVLWVTTYYIGVVQMAPGAPLWWGIFVCSIIALGVALPSAPAGVGVFEASMVAALSLLGVDSSSALAYAIILHFSQVIIAVILGVWGLIREKQSLTSLVSRSPLKTSNTITQD